MDERSSIVDELNTYYKCMYYTRHYCQLIYNLIIIVIDSIIVLMIASSNYYHLMLF